MFIVGKELYYFSAINPIFKYIIYIEDKSNQITLFVIIV